MEYYYSVYYLDPNGKHQYYQSVGVDCLTALEHFKKVFKDGYETEEDPHVLGIRRESWTGKDRRNEQR